MLNFDDEQDQKEFNYGPVPAGSIVVVQMKVLIPHEYRQKTDNKYISVAESGLRQLYCQFDVVKGTYQGVSWRQNITLPRKNQVISLTEKQETACRIGGSQFKAILNAAQKRSVNDWPDFTDLRFPVKVKINNQPSESKSGQIFWKNEISMIITQDKAEYNIVRQQGEIINESGAVKGNGKPAKWKDDRMFGTGMADMVYGMQSENSNYDEVPF